MEMVELLICINPYNGTETHHRRVIEPDNGFQFADPGDIGTNVRRLVDFEICDI